MAATNLRDRLLVTLLFRLGCRITEALSLTVEDINLQEGTITILHLKSRMVLNCPECGARLSKSHAFCPGCGSRVERASSREMEQRRFMSVPVDRETLSMLKEYIARGGPVHKGGKQLLVGISRSRAWQVVKECAERAGLEPLVNAQTGGVHHVSPHRLRDAFAVMAVKRNDSNDSIRMLQEQLGHASISTTMRYRKVAGSELRSWYDNLWQDGDDVEEPAS